MFPRAFTTSGNKADDEGTPDDAHYFEKQQPPSAKKKKEKDSRNFFPQQSAYKQRAVGISRYPCRSSRGK